LIHISVWNYNKRRTGNSTSNINIFFLKTSLPKNHQEQIENDFKPDLKIVLITKTYMFRISVREPFDQQTLTPRNPFEHKFQTKLLQ